MIGGGRLGAEVTVGSDEPVTEEGTPGPVDGDPVAKRVVGACQPTGEFQAVDGLFLILQFKDLRNARRYRVLRAGVFTAVAQKGRAWVVGRALEHYERMVETGNPLFQIIERLALFFPAGIPFEK